MKVCCVIIAIVFCLITVEGRHFHQKDTNIDLNESVDIKHVRNKPERRMRNRRQSFYNNQYDYLNGYQHIGVGDFLKDILFSVREIETHVKQGGINRYYPSYYENRPSYSNKCEDTLKELLTLYKELSSQLKYSHPPPPQIIYVSYPSVDKTPSNVTIEERIYPNDTNRIWMNIPINTGVEDNNDDGTRPLSFRPKEPSNRPNKTPPPFDHGTSQAGIQTTVKPTIKPPGPCEAAILSCCGLKTEQEQEKCFAAYSCSNSYGTGLACDANVIKTVLDNFTKMYGPVNEF